MGLFDVFEDIVDVAVDVVKLPVAITVDAVKLDVEHENTSKVLKDTAKDVEKLVDDIVE